MGVVSPERRRTRHAPSPPPPGPPPRRDVPWGLIALGIVILTLVAGVSWIRGVFPDFDNPFAEETKIRSGPALLQSIRDIGEYRSVAGNFQVIVDLEQDTRLPSEILGERTLFVAVGSVDAGVNLSRLGEDDVDVSDDRRSATITLPAVRLFPAVLDVGRSYVYERERGLLNKIGSVFSDEGDQRELYVAAERRLNEAAREESGLVPRAEENTRAMLESLLRSLGFTSATVRFER
jgi:Protein of unknown function (DUF4230)